MHFKKHPLAFAYQLANKPQTGFSQINSHALHFLSDFFFFFPAACSPSQVLLATGRKPLSVTSLGGSLCPILPNTPQIQDLVHDLSLFPISTAGKSQWASAVGF